MVGVLSILNLITHTVFITLSKIAHLPWKPLHLHRVRSTYGYLPQSSRISWRLRLEGIITFNRVLNILFRLWFGEFKKITGCRFESGDRWVPKFQIAGREVISLSDSFHVSPSTTVCSKSLAMVRYIYVFC